jgi:archaeosortase B (VPXXXP-CTERM-specific)
MRRNPSPATGRKPRVRVAAASRPWIGFVARFATYAVLLFALYWTSEAVHAFHHVNVVHATATAAVLRGFGIDAQAHATSIVMPQGILEIVAECTGIYVLILFAAGVLAFPAEAATRLRGLALGVPCIVGLNFVRLLSLGMVMRFRAAWLPWFHEYLWQVLFVGLVAALYAVWVARSGSKHGLFPAR